MAYEAILYDKHEHVAVLTLNRPERLNAISGAVREEVHEAVQAAQDDDEVRALIITGEGRGFCSGADLSGAPRRRSRVVAERQAGRRRLGRALGPALRPF